MSTTADRVKRAAVEFAIVVLGVATALAAENWRESLAERRTEEEYLTRLQDELRAGRPTIEDQHSRVLGAIAAMDSLLDVDHREVPDLPMLVSTSAGYNFVGASVVLDQTYREMLATGTLNLVTDRETRLGISHYFRIAARFEDNLERQVSNGYSTWANRVVGASGHSARTVSSAPGLLDPEVRARMSLIVETEGWRDEVRLTRVGLANLVHWLGNLLEGTDALILTLNARATSF